MDKSKQKRKQHNSLAVHITAEKFGYTDRYVRACLNGDRVGVMADEIKKVYKDACAKISDTVSDLKTVKP